MKLITTYLLILSLFTISLNCLGGIGIELRKQQDRVFMDLYNANIVTDQEHLVLVKGDLIKTFPTYISTLECDWDLFKFPTDQDVIISSDALIKASNSVQEGEVFFSKMIKVKILGPSHLNLFYLEEPYSKTNKCSIALRLGVQQTGLTIDGYNKIHERSLQYKKKSLNLI